MYKCCSTEDKMYVLKCYIERYPDDPIYCDMRWPTCLNFRNRVLAKGYITYLAMESHARLIKFEQKLSRN